MVFVCTWQFRNPASRRVFPAARVGITLKHEDAKAQRFGRKRLAALRSIPSRAASLLSMSQNGFFD
jgi:hypothetical protein